MREGLREAAREQALSAVHGPLLGPGRRELARVLEPVIAAVCSWGELGDVTLYRSRHRDGRVTWTLRVDDGDSADWELGSTIEAIAALQSALAVITAESPSS